MIRRLRAAIPAAWVGAALIGCSSRPTGAGREASRLTILCIGDERILGPEHEEAQRFLVFLPLVETSDTGEVQGRLAQRWSHSPDFRVWTFHLRPNVRWHDGVPVTARDIEFSLALYQQPAMAWDPPNAYQVRVLDDSTLTISYPKRPRDPFHEWKVFWPKHLLERLDPKEIMSWDFWVHPIGNGPYRYVRHVPQTMVELQANPDFYAGKPRIEHVILKFGGSTPIAELLSGNVDAVEDFNGADLPRIAADSQFRTYYSVEPIGLEAIFWNHRSSFFRDALVRRALTLGINRRELWRVLNLPADLRIADALFTPRQYQRDELPDPLPYDPDSAARLLDAAGWKDADGDGVRERSGQAFRFIALAALKGPMVVGRAAVYVQDQLRRIGVRMEVQTMDGSAVGKRLRAGQFEAAFFPFFNKVDGGARQWFSEGSAIGYRNPRMISLLQAVTATNDPEEIEQIYLRLMPIFREDLPITFLFPQVSTYVAARRVRGLRSPFEADPIMQMEHLWLEGGR